MLAHVILLCVCVSYCGACIPTVTPDDMYEQEMEGMYTPTSVLMATMTEVMTPSTSPATAAPTSAGTVAPTTVPTTTSTAPSVTTTTTPTTTTTTTTVTTTTTPTTTTTTTSAASTSTTTSTTTTTTTGGTCSVSMWFYFNGYCYFASTSLPAGMQILSFLNADASCGSMGMAGGRLVSIHSQAENDFVYSVLTNYAPNRYYYIGARSYANTGVFIWLDGTTFDWTNWKDWTEPNANPMIDRCVGMYMMNNGYDMTWNDDGCGSQYYICKAPAS